MTDEALRESIAGFLVWIAFEPVGNASFGMATDDRGKPMVLSDDSLARLRAVVGASGSRQGRCWHMTQEFLTALDATTDEDMGR